MKNEPKSLSSTVYPPSSPFLTLIPGPPIRYASVRLSLLNINPFTLLVFKVPREVLKVNTEPIPISIGFFEFSGISILLKFNLTSLSLAANIALTVESSVAFVSTCAI